MEVDVKKYDWFEMAQGLYWFCADFHSGQFSDLYAVLSNLDYQPARTESAPDTSEGLQVYGLLEEAYLAEGEQEAVDIAEEMFAEIERRADE